ncbi:MAG: hypothetical protein ABJM43_20430 [Paracoccaceae bacterium]
MNIAMRRYHCASSMRFFPLGFVTQARRKLFLTWSLEVVTEDGTSIVWDDLFEDDGAAFEEAISTIHGEGAVAFANGGSNVVPFKQQTNGP